MEANGLVVRHRRIDDERSVEVELTERGLALKSKARSIPERLVCALELPDEDLAALRESLRRVAANALDQARTES